MAYSNIQEVNVNYVSGHPMISPHSNNKEVTKKNICYPMRYMVTTVSYQLYYTRQLIYIYIYIYIYIIYIYQLHEWSYMIIPHYIIFIVYVQLQGHITPPCFKWKAYICILFSILLYNKLIIDIPNTQSK